MDLVLDDIFTKTPYKHKASLLIYLSEQAAAKGYYWSYATRLFDDKVQEYVKMNPDNEPICEVEKEVCVEADLSKQVLDSMCIEKLKDIMTGNGFFHSLQVSSSPCPESSVIEVSKSCIIVPLVLGRRSAAGSSVLVTW